MTDGFDFSVHERLYHAIGQTDFAIGNIRRTPSSSNFLGLIDEVGISDIARGPADLIFVPNPAQLRL